MRYPIQCKNIVDVTKEPYFADNTGKTDCTEALRRVFDDILSREVKGVEETVKRLNHLSENGTKDIYDGFENKIVDGVISVIYPHTAPASRIIYFPNGTYLVSDTVTYTIKNLQNIFKGKPFSELCRGIHIQGESMEGVCIKLADGANGFDEGAQKPVISFINAEEFAQRECSNVDQLNTIEDLTIDCGAGNPGAVGIRFSASNSGRIENITIKAESGYTGLISSASSEGSFRNVDISGFDYGMVIPKSSIFTLESMELSKNKKAAIRTFSSKMVCEKINHGEIPCFEFDKGAGIYYLVDMEFEGNTNGNRVYTEKEPHHLRNMKIPQNNRSQNPEDWVCVDDFGAIGDGVTDSTEAIQKAMNCGKPVIIFGEGHYFVNGEITIPATVQTIDFMFCDFFAGEDLINNEGGALFRISEDSDQLLFMENLYTFEQFYGYMHLINHGARRDLAMIDLHTQAAAMYKNTVSGSRVYIDNCIVTSGTYSCNAILRRGDLPPFYCHIVPYEFHGQTVYAKQLNPERADIELLNDGSDILIDGYKVEGPGTALKTVNGGKTVANIVSCAIGYTKAPFGVFVTENAQTEIWGAGVYGINADLDYNMIIEEISGEVCNRVYRNEIPHKISEFGRSINHYQSGKLEELY